MFSLNMKPYAITGTSSKPLGPGVKVDVRDSRRVRIATMNALGDVAETSRESNAWGAGFGELRSGCETLGSFSIKTDGELQESDDSKGELFFVCTSAILDTNSAFSKYLSLQGSGPLLYPDQLKNPLPRNHIHRSRCSSPRVSQRSCPSGLLHRTAWCEHRHHSSS